MLNNYVPLHCHTYFSALDGLNSPLEYFKRAKELGMTHMSITDHETLAGHREAQLAGKGTGISPVGALVGKMSA